MNARDEQLLTANWDRMRLAITRATTEYRRIADELDGISFVSTAGLQRSPDAIISQAALTADPGRIHADMIHRLATWAETINELLQHRASIPEGTISSRILCDYAIDDPDRSCVLTLGHGLPTDDGLVVHVSADGVTFA